MTFEEKAARQIIISLAGPRACRRLNRWGPLYRTSIHEAAHAVVGRVMGLYVSCVTNVPHECGTQTTLGYVVFSDSPQPRRLDDSGSGVRPSDRRCVMIALTLMTAEKCTWYELRRHIRAFEEKTDLLLEKHWLAIEGLAGLLLWERHIAFDELEAVFRRFGLV